MLKIRSKYLKIWVKSLTIQAKSLKLWGKILENPDKNGVQRCFSSQNGPNVCRKTHEDPFVEVTPKKCLYDLRGR